MNTTSARPRITQPLTKRNVPHASREADKLVAMGRARFWPFQILGRAPMLEEPVRLGDWLLIPAQQDTTAIPPRAAHRIRAIFAAGIRPEGFVLVHEAPKLLKAPPTAPAAPRPGSGTIYSPDATGDFVASLANGIAGLTSMILPMLFFVVAAAIADPILVALVRDDVEAENLVWVEICRWDAE